MKRLAFVASTAAAGVALAVAPTSLVGPELSKVTLFAVDGSIAAIFSARRAVDRTLVAHMVAQGPATVSSFYFSSVSAGSLGQMHTLTAPIHIEAGDTLAITLTTERAMAV